MRGEELLEGLTERDLKPSIPDIGEKVYIIKGEHKGSIGTLYV